MNLEMKSKYYSERIWYVINDENWSISIDQVSNTTYNGTVYEFKKLAQR